jgi:hypothetical protein
MPPAGQQRASTDMTGNQYLWLTDWQPTIGVDDVDANMKVRAMTSTMNWQLAVQYATIRTDKPGAPAVLDALQTTGAGERGVNGIQLSGTTEMYFRMGYMYASPNAGTLVAADLWLQIAYTACGSIIGTGTTRLEATSTDDRYLPISGWMSRKAAAKVKAAFVGAQYAGSGFRFQLAQQKATTSIEAPDAWAGLQASTYYTSAGENNTGEVTCSYTSQLLTRFGIKYNLSAGSYGAADVSWALCVRS